MHLKFILTLLAVYFIFINILSASLTVVDKKNAVRNKRRIPEKTLMAIGFFGGAVAEYFVMKKIHHKTLQKKFMIGLPIEIFINIILIILIIFKVAK